MAAGVAKANADVVLISGHDGGTGASPLSSIKNTASPWELGLSEAHQALVANGLRERVRLRVDGGIKTGADIVMAASLGADEFGFGSAALVALACVMARQCHLNTCPVGVATQREDLRLRFPREPDRLVNYLRFVAQHVRELLARLGVRSLEELNGRTVAFPEGGYRGSYIETVAAQVQERVGATLLNGPTEQAEQRCRELAYQELLELIRQDLRSFGIEFNSWFSEASLLSSGSVEKTLEELRRRDLLFEQDRALWFRSSVFGDEKDRVVRKQDGEYTYLASDIVYHRDKLLRGYDLLIDVWGADHHGYIPRMEAVVQAYGHPKNRLRVVLVQMVNLMRGGKRIEMSKRAGEFITMREVMDEVGVDAAKFFFLMRRSDTHLDFDLELAKQQSAENPVYYVQYAHARIASLFRVAHERGIPVPKPSETDLGLLTHPDEFSVIRKLSSYPSVIQASAAALEPHRLTFYLQELAVLLHTFYYKHRIMPPAAEVDAPDAERFVTDTGAPVARYSEPVTPGLTAARLALMREVQRVIRNGLRILGISAPDRM